MTQLFGEDGERISATIIEAGPCYVTAVRDAERDGYRAVQLAFGETTERRLKKPRLGHLKKAGAPALRHLAEFALDENGAEEPKASAASARTRIEIRISVIVKPRPPARLVLARYGPPVLECWIMPLATKQGACQHPP